MDETRVCRSTDYSLPFKIISLIYEVINYLLLKFRFAIQYYYYADLKVLDFINELRFSHDLLLTVPESLQLYEIAKVAVRIKGDYAEVGVYRGGSAKIIALVKGAKKLHLFDTFSGLPPVDKKDKYFKPGEYVASLEYVKDLCKDDSNLYFYQGVFPASAKKAARKRYALVHLDVDLYQSTKDCLEYFYPKMSKGGMILSHDYPSSVGVKKAFDEFMKNKPELVIKLFGNQCLIVKI